MDAQTSQTETVEATLQYDVTGTRIVAALLDIVVLAVLFTVMALAFGDTGKESSDGGASFHIRLENGPFVLFLLLQFAYFVLLEGFFAATLGKMVMGLRVVKADGSPYSWSSVIVRNLLRFIDGLPVFYLVGLITVAVSKKNQRLGDMAAGTLVVRAR